MSDKINIAQQQLHPIFISCDGWLAVFELLPVKQLGFVIAMISPRFARYVDEHFRTRKWSIGKMQIQWKEFEDNRELQIVNKFGDLPIPQITIPKKALGFELIRLINYVDQPAVFAFMQNLHPLFTACRRGINVSFHMDGEPMISQFIMDQIWPMFNENVCALKFEKENDLQLLRHVTPSVLADCPKLRIIVSHGNLFPEMPANDSATGTDGQAMSKWLLAPCLADDAPKILIIYWSTKKLAEKFDQLKTDFRNASSRANFIINNVDYQISPNFTPFEETNESTGESLVYKAPLLIRRPIVHDVNKWSGWEKEALLWFFDDQFNKFMFSVVI